MAMYSFAKAITEGRKIALYDEGLLLRDFTYIDDIVLGIVSVLFEAAKSDETWSEQLRLATSIAPYRIFNIGNEDAVEVRRVVSLIERHLGKTARVEFLPRNPADVRATFADISDLTAQFGFLPKTSIEEGVEKFVSWFKEFHKLTSASRTIGNAVSPNDSIGVSL